MFDAKKWSKTKARTWLSKHGFKTPAADVGDRYMHFRQRLPFHFVKGSSRTITLDSKRGIKAVVACPRPGYESDKKKKPGAKIRPSSKRTKKPVEKKSAGRKPKRTTTVTTTTTKKTRVQKNPRFKAPKIVVQHGRCVELVVDIGGDQVAKYTWPKTGKRAMWLLTDGAGKRLIVCPFNKKAVKGSTFQKRLESVPSSSRAKAFAQWMISTDQDTGVGSIVKMPERSIKKIGRAISITYYFDLKHRDGAPREHKFESSPLVKSDTFNNPTLIVISGGDLEITGAGIEG